MFDDSIAPASFQHLHHAWEFLYTSIFETTVLYTLRQINGTKPGTAHPAALTRMSHLTNKVGKTKGRTLTNGVVDQLLSELHSTVQRHGKKIFPRFLESNRFY